MVYSETRNLGDLFNEKIKGQRIDYSHRNNPAFKEKTKNKKKKSTKFIKRDGKYKNSGIAQVAKILSFDYKQGYYFKFTYHNPNKKKQQSVQSKNLLDLYYKVINLGYDFVIQDEKKARNFIDENCNDKDYKTLFNKLFKEKKK